METKFFKDKQGKNIRFWNLRNPEPKGTVVVCQGYRQILEQYEDIATNLYSKGYSVYMFDLKGQGGSDRYLDDKRKIHSEGFEDHVNTLHEFVNKVVVKEGEMILQAHSMGGNIALRYLHEHPNVFDKAVCMATMAELNDKAISPLSAKIMTDFAVAAGAGGLERAVPKVRVNEFEKSGGLGRNKLAVKKIFQAVRKNKSLLTSGPTVGLLKSVMDSIAVVRGANDDGSPYVSSIKTPVMFYIPTDDEMASPASQEQLAEKMPNAKCYYTKGGHNALFAEDNDVVQTMVGFIERGEVAKASMEAASVFNN